MYALPTDFASVRWKHPIAGRANDINPDSNTDGRANHANRSENINDFLAFRVCENATFGGYTDWYLPARDELNELYIKLKQGKPNGTLGFDEYSYYASSTEVNNNNALVYDFYDGGSLGSDKQLIYNVRCIRRQ